MANPTIPSTASCHRSDSPIAPTLEDCQYLLQSARCLLWRATVEYQDDAFHWQLDPFDLEAAQRFLPLDLGDGERYADAWFRAKHPEDTPRMDENAETAMREGLERYSQEFRCTDRDGKQRWFYEDVKVERVAKSRWRLVGVVTDITEQIETAEALKSHEQRYTALFEAVNDAVYITTTDGAFVEANRAMLALLGYRRSELSRLNVTQLYANPSDRHRFQRAIAQRGTVREYPIPLRQKNGTVLDCLLTASVRHDAAGNVIGYQGIVRDVTEQRRLERAVLEICEHERQRIGSDLHDDIGQQLTGAAMTIDALAKTLERVGRFDLAALAHDATKRVCAARSHSKALASGLVPIPLVRSGLAAALGALATTVTRTQGIDCRFTADGAATQTPWRENLTLGTHLYRIAQEAVNNAAKHSGAREIVVELSVVDPMVTLTVTDDGMGIRPTSKASDGMGIPLMHYRARAIFAQLHLQRRASGGTVVQCSVDLAKTPRSHKRSAP